jgi:16S rRNA (guanine527-N7)-methyltransferase
MVEVIDAESFLASTHVSRETLERLTVYESLLLKWQKSINLVATSTLEELWARHMLDSAQLARIAPQSTQNWLDMGSGGGFPGLVVAILLSDRPGFQMNLVESDHRKSIFLKEAARLTGAPVTVHAVRMERLSKAPPLPDVISARALGPLSRLLSYSADFFRSGTTGLFLKGAGVQGELTEASKDWIFDHEAIPSQSDPSGVVLKIWGREDGNIRRAAK